MIKTYIKIQEVKAVQLTEDNILEVYDILNKGMPKDSEEEIILAISEFY